MTAHLLDPHDRHRFTGHPTRKPANEREARFARFYGNRCFTKQARDLTNQPRAFLFTRHLRAVCLARSHGKQSDSITTER